MSKMPKPKLDPRALHRHSKRMPCNLARTQLRAYGIRLRFVSSQSPELTCPDCKAAEALMVLEDDLDEKPAYHYLEIPVPAHPSPSYIEMLMKPATLPHPGILTKEKP